MNPKDHAGCDSGSAGESRQPPALDSRALDERPPVGRRVIEPKTAYVELVVIETTAFSVKRRLCISEALLEELQEQLAYGRLVGEAMYSERGISYRRVKFLTYRIAYVDMRAMGQILLIDIWSDDDRPEPPPPAKGKLKKLLKKLAWLALGTMVRQSGKSHDESDDDSGLLHSAQQPHTPLFGPFDAFTTGESRGGGAEEDAARFNQEDECDSLRVTTDHQISAFLVSSAERIGHVRPTARQHVLCSSQSSSGEDVGAVRRDTDVAFFVQDGFRLSCKS